MTLFDEPSRKPLPEPEFGDVSRAAARGLMAMVPFGNVASELWALLGPPVSQRRDRWLEDLERRLHELEGKIDGFRFDDLGQNEQFVSATLQATQSALRTHQEEKLEALRNAVLNVATGRSPDEDQQTMFLSYIDELSPWHIRLLLFLQNPQKLIATSTQQPGAFGANGVRVAGSISQYLEEVYPELRGKRDFYDQIMRDLRSRGLINSSADVLYTMMTASPSGIFAKRTTETADRFLRFITAPI